jgi:hypothetical protein
MKTSNDAGEFLAQGAVVAKMFVLPAIVAGMLAVQGALALYLCVRDLCGALSARRFPKPAPAALCCDMPRNEPGAAATRRVAADRGTT